MPHTVHLRLLGDFSLVVDGALIQSIAGTRLQALLAYLALRAGTSVTRQQIAFLFWPDSSESQARNNLRQLVYLLRRLFPSVERYLHVDAMTLCWQPDATFSLDTADVYSALAHAAQSEQSSDENSLRDALIQSIDLYKGDLLPGCYDDWIIPEREQLYVQYLGALDQLIQLLERRQAYTGAITYAQRRLRHDPLHEESYCRLMRLYTHIQDRSSALRTYHACREALQQELGIEPSASTQALYEDALQLDARQAPGIELPLVAATPELIGRHAALGQLFDAWRAATSRPHLALITGEAGIGKSRLAEEVVSWAAARGVIVAATRAYAAEGSLPYAPVADWLRSPVLRGNLDQLAPIWRTELARLLPELLATHPELAQPGPLSEPWQRQRFYEALARAMCQARRPLLLLLDDIQWCDIETLAWLHYLLRFAGDIPLLLVATARADELAADQTRAAWCRSLQASDRLLELPLGALDPAQTGKLAASLAGYPLDDMAAARLYAETEGNPLFVVEMVRAQQLVDGPVLSQEASTWSMPVGNVRTLPPKVQAVIAGRLAGLSPLTRELVRLAAIVGRAFSVDVLVHAGDTPAAEVMRGLDELWRRHILREHGVEGYDFSHDLIREVAYAEPSAVHRRQLHLQVARAFEVVYANNLGPVCAQIALHYGRAGHADQAIAYYQRAAAGALQVYAHDEASELLGNALGFLEQCPAGAERDTRELDIQTARGVALIASKGYGAPAVIAAYDRVWSLSQALARPATPELLAGIARIALSQSAIERAYACGGQLFELAEQRCDALLEIEARYVLGVASFWKGALAESRAQLEQLVAQYDPQQQRTHTTLFAQDAGVVGQIRLAHTLWYLGCPNDAERACQDALALARVVGHPLSQAYALAFAAWIAIDRSDVTAASEYTTELVALSEAQQLAFWPPTGQIFGGWVQAQQGRPTEGITLVLSGIDAYRASGQLLHVPYALVLLAGLYAQVGACAAGLRAVDEGLALVVQTGQRAFEAELYRLRGELLLADGADDQAVEDSLSYAHSLARRQGSALFELRAAVGLARLWQRQERTGAPRQILADVLSKISSTPGNPDEQAAQSLLHALENGTSPLGADSQA